MKNVMTSNCPPMGLAFVAELGGNSGCDDVEPESRLNLSPENGLLIGNVLNQAAGRSGKKVALHQVNA